MFLCVCVCEFRHQINLRADLLDSPDFYWDHEGLEPLYLAVHNHLDILRRTKVFAVIASRYSQTFQHILIFGLMMALINVFRITEVEDFAFL